MTEHRTPAVRLASMKPYSIEYGKRAGLKGFIREALNASMKPYSIEYGKRRRMCGAPTEHADASMKPYSIEYGKHRPRYARPERRQRFNEAVLNRVRKERHAVHRPRLVNVASMKPYSIEYGKLFRVRVAVVARIASMKPYSIEYGKELIPGDPGTPAPWLQ